MIGRQPIGGSQRLAFRVVILREIRLNDDNQELSVVLDWLRFEYAADGLWAGEFLRG